jgi:tetratricopeptide (TPR) repeat protein
VTEPGNAVFLSYASQDAEAAQKLCSGLRAAGIEVWLDQSELRGGDAWDQKIRRQIRSCALFVPLISTNTRVRTEGYFRLEWKLAIDRSHLMAPDRPFLVPVAIDGGAAADTTVPERFRDVQWTPLPAGEPTPQFVARVAQLLNSAREAPTEPQAMVGRGDGPSAMPPPPRQSDGRGGRYKVFTAVGLALLLLCGAGWWYRRTVAPAPVVPYSAEDRRMTFAVLPIEAPPDDPVAAQLARTSTAALYGALDRNTLWVHLIRDTAVSKALGQFTAPHELAVALNVHFLVRGSVVRDDTRYTLTLYTVDGETERSLGTQSLSTPRAPIRPYWTDDVDDASGTLVFYGLEEEVRRAESRPDDSLDVRDLTFRAYLRWGNDRRANDPKGAYDSATQLLQRALTRSPDDALALEVTAQVNLCDCVMAWSKNVAEQQAIGEAALDRFLARHPDSPNMLVGRGHLYALRGRRAEQLSVLEDALHLEPRLFPALLEKSEALLALSRAREALDVAKLAQDRKPDDPTVARLLADIQYALGNYADAEQLARRAMARRTHAELINPYSGAIRLTLLAAAGQLHDQATARAALADLQTDLPTLTSVAAVRDWMGQLADLKGYEPLFEGLRMAGLHD